MKKLNDGKHETIWQQVFLTKRSDDNVQLMNDKIEEKLMKLKNYVFL